VQDEVIERAGAARATAVVNLPKKLGRRWNGGICRHERRKMRNYQFGLALFIVVSSVGMTGAAEKKGPRQKKMYPSMSR
jgi:hypothetical protein